MPPPRGSLWPQQWHDLIVWFFLLSHFFEMFPLRTPWNIFSRMLRKLNLQLMWAALHCVDYNVIKSVEGGGNIMWLVAVVHALVVYLIYGPNQVKVGPPPLWPPVTQKWGAYVRMVTYLWLSSDAYMFDALISFWTLSCVCSPLARNLYIPNNSIICRCARWG